MFDVFTNQHSNNGWSKDTTAGKKKNEILIDKKIAFPLWRDRLRNDGKFKILSS